MRLAAGDTILLGTDGLTELVPHVQIADVLKSSHNVEAAARQLIDRVNSAGGRDNITVLLARYHAATKGLADRAELRASVQRLQSHQQDLAERGNSIIDGVCLG